jgi:hypothetical protein
VLEKGLAECVETEQHRQVKITLAGCVASQQCRRVEVEPLRGTGARWTLRDGSQSRACSPRRSASPVDAGTIAKTSPRAMTDGEATR